MNDSPELLGEYLRFLFDKADDREKKGKKRSRGSGETGKLLNAL